MISEARMVEFRLDAGFWKPLLLWSGGIVLGVFLLSVVVTWIIVRWRKRRGRNSE